MKTVVYPHDMGIGGSQLNAIELAARVTAAGHPTAVFGRPGPLVDRVRELGLEFILSPPPGRRPSMRVARALSAVVQDRGIDVVHGYEWPPSLEAFLVCRGRSPAVAVSTVMSMAVAPFLPRSMPLQVGTEQIAAAERLAGRAQVTVLEPPVDLALNNAAAAGLDVDGFRRRWALPDDGTLTVVVVTRLAHEMKSEGVLVAIRTVGELAAQGRRIRLVVVGDGPARATVQDAAGAVNAAAAASVVVLTGELTDPRPAYALADVVLGMGGSALRALAFGKPLVVQGEQGFWRTLTAQSVDDFLWTGWYGVGGEGATALARALVGQFDPGYRAELGRFGLSVVQDRFSLDRAAQLQIAHYETALGATRSRWRSAPDTARSAGGFAGYKFQRKWASLTSRSAAVDDFNSRPVAAGGPVRPSG